VATLHITNGSSAGDKLQTFVDGPVILMADVLHEGPAPRVDDDRWYETRARFLGGADRGRVDEIREGLAAADRAVRDAVARGDEITLWFEHDLFDQLELIRVLDMIVRLKPDATKATDVGAGVSRPVADVGAGVSRPVADVAAGLSAPVAGVGAGFSRPVFLICIDRFPGVDRFVGLGQLEPAQLATLYPSRQPVTGAQVALASAAWDAFRAPDPRALGALATGLKSGDGALPFLGPALLRFLAEYPSAATGLTHTETLALTALAERGPLSAGALFGATQRRESSPFMGDSTFFDIVAALASARVPLVSTDSPPERVAPHARVASISDAGRDVLAGRADHVALNGVDMWRGGVHLNGGGPPWRWDAGRETLVS